MPEGNRPGRVPGRDFERAAIAGSEQIGFPALLAAPDRADGMNDELGGQPVSAGPLGIPGGASTETSAFVQQSWPRRSMDGAIDSAATEQRIVGGIDDGINHQRGDVGLDDAENDRHMSPLRKARLRFHLGGKIQKIPDHHVEGTHLPGLAGTLARAVNVTAQTLGRRGDQRRILDQRSTVQGSCQITTARSPRDDEQKITVDVEPPPKP